MQIRDATIADKSQLQSLWDDQYDFHYQLNSEYYEFTKKTRRAWSAFLAEVLSDLTTFVLVAVDKNVLVGFVRCVVVELNEYNREQLTVGEIEDIYVVPARRGDGTAKLLLDGAENELANRAVSYIRVQCHTENGGANKFYAKQGYSLQQSIYYKQVKA